METDGRVPSKTEHGKMVEGHIRGLSRNRQGGTIRQEEKGWTRE